MIQVVLVNADKYNKLGLWTDILLYWNAELEKESNQVAEARNTKLKEVNK